MEKFDKTAYEIVRRLQSARLSLIKKQPFYAYLLLHMRFAVDLTCETAYTDGVRIAFNPDFINELSDEELEFVLMHEVLHVVLEHPFRKQSDYDLETFDIACDIVVNSNILYSFGMDLKRITLKKYGVSMHLAPSGEEGFMFDVDQVYRELMRQKANNAENSSEESCDDCGEVFSCKTEEKSPSGEDTESDNSTGEDSAGGDHECVKNPSLNPSSSASSGKGKNSKSPVFKGTKSDSDDISEDDMNAMIAGLLTRQVEPEDNETGIDEKENNRQGLIDDHSFWNGDDEDNSSRATWLNRMIEATELVKISSSSTSCGNVPLCAERIIEKFTNPVLDWRTILNDFVQEEICDYSFAPPDKRMQDCEFFLPDFNEKDNKIENILFMVDTSGSMSDEQITECYSEIYGAITQFDGKLAGKLGFFDGVVVDPVPFENEEELKIIRPVGGGGTNFHIIFDYVEREMSDQLPVSIVILTDGYAPFPEESSAMGIPVLWIINNDNATPPWGKIARIIDNAP